MTTRQAFTLTELLIASTLSGLVMALAVRGFSEINRVGAKTTSRLEASGSASTALQQLSAMMRRASIMFHDPRPISNPAAADAASVRLQDNFNATANFTVAATPYRGQVPPFLRAAAAPPGNTALYRFTSFRAYSAGTLAPLAVPPLLAAVPGRTAADNWFYGPLAYWAEAKYYDHGSASRENTRATMPAAWNFHVLYLAPMRLGPRDANLANPNSRQDLNPALANLPRTAMPLELRLLTIPNVNAGRPSVNLGHPDFDAVSGRLRDPSSTVGAPTFLAPPFDYDGLPTSGNPAQLVVANYDPIPVPYDSTAPVPPGPLGAIALTSGVWPRGAAPGGGTRDPSGPRILGLPVHANFNDVGNDPPSENALADRWATAGNPIDRVILPYVDPDHPLGTSVRLSNNLVNAANQLQGGYCPAIGPGCVYRDHYADGLFPPVPAGPSGRSGAKGTLPSKALISLTVRHRKRLDIPFQFATVSAEIDLEGLRAFNQVRPRR